MPDVALAFRRRWRQDDASQLRREVLGVVSPPLRQLRQARQLRQRYRRRDIREAVVVPKLHGLVALALAVAAQASQTLRQLGVVSRDQAALARGHVLRCVEGEAARPEAAGAAAAS